jgi:hypothetical protein
VSVSIERSEILCREPLKRRSAHDLQVEVGKPKTVTGRGADLTDYLSRFELVPNRELQGAEMAEKEVGGPHRVGCDDYPRPPPLKLQSVIKYIYYRGSKWSCDRCPSGGVAIDPHVEIAPHLIEIGAS